MIDRENAQMSRAYWDETIEKSFVLTMTMIRDSATIVIIIDIDCAANHLYFE